jgi:mRNA interferase MazF
MINYSFGDILLVPFPFTNQTGTKKRPAVVINSGTYNQRHNDLVLMAITSRIRMPLNFGELEIVE